MSYAHSAGQNGWQLLNILIISKRGERSFSFRLRRPAAKPHSVGTDENILPSPPSGAFRNHCVCAESVLLDRQLRFSKRCTYRGTRAADSHCRAGSPTTEGAIFRQADVGALT